MAVAEAIERTRRCGVINGCYPLDVADAETLITAASASSALAAENEGVKEVLRKLVSAFKCSDGGASGMEEIAAAIRGAENVIDVLSPTEKHGKDE